jgi:hypothetical protein
MNEGSGAVVFWILVPLFVAVGLYLLWYSRRRKKMIQMFAKIHQFRIRPEVEKELQKTLDTFFSLKDDRLVRSFGQLSSLVEGESIWLFRAVELLDLNPHAQSYTTHFSRIVALFETSTEHEEFFMLDKSKQAKQRLPRLKSPNTKIAEIVKLTAASCKARHPLSVTITRGHGLIYFEPLVTGGETIGDVNSLYCVAKGMCEKLSENV